MTGIENKIINKAFDHLLINLSKLSLSDKEDIVKARLYLSSLKYKFISRYSYYFYVLASKQPLIYESDFRYFCDNMKINEVNPNSSQFLKVIKELEKAYDIEVYVNFPRISFKVYNIINDNFSWATMNFGIMAKIPRLYKIQLNQEFELYYSAICEELGCKNYQNFAHFRQNVLEQLDRDYDMKYEVSSKTGKMKNKVEKIKFTIYNVKAPEKDIKK